MGADESRTVSHKELDDAYTQHVNNCDVIGVKPMSRQDFMHHHIANKMAQLRREHREAVQWRQLKPITDRLDRIIELLEGK